MHDWSSGFKIYPVVFSSRLEGVPPPLRPKKHKKCAQNGYADIPAMSGILIISKQGIEWWFLSQKKANRTHMGLAWSVLKYQMPSCRSQHQKLASSHPRVLKCLTDFGNKLCTRHAEMCAFFHSETTLRFHKEIVNGSRKRTFTTMFYGFHMTLSSIQIIILLVVNSLLRKMYKWFWKF